MIGSKNQFATALRDIAMPIMTPNTAQIANAVSARYSVSAVLIHRSPDQASLQMRATTSLSAGNW